MLFEKLFISLIEDVLLYNIRTYVNDNRKLPKQLSAFNVCLSIFPNGWVCERVRNRWWAREGERKRVMKKDRYRVVIYRSLINPNEQKRKKKKTGWNSMQ